MNGRVQGDGTGASRWWERRAPGVAVAAILLALVILVNFREARAHGMNYDEVLRLNPLVSLVNPDAEQVDQSIYSVEVGSQRLPVMVKSYISSITSVHLLPALLWDDPASGLRILYGVYLWIACLLLFLFLVRYGFVFALGSAALLAASPHLYPEIRFGFASVVHVIVLTAAAFCWRRAFETGRASLWFLGGLCFGLAVNLRGPTMWTVGGLCAAGLILYPRVLFAQLRRPRVLLAAAAGCLLGGANYVVYNLATGGGTFRPFVTAMFRRKEYNRDPIDFRQLPDLSVELASKLRGLHVVLGGPGLDAVVFFATASVAGVALLVFAWRVLTGRELRSRALLLPAVALLFTWTFIFLTPKSGRAGHWAYLSPLLEISLMSGALAIWGSRASGPRWRQIVAVALGAALVVASFAVTWDDVSTAVRTQGDGLFSPMIYEIAADVDDLDPEEHVVVAVDWGFWSQLYFLSEGEAPLSEYTFRFLRADDHRAAEILGSLLVAQRGQGRDVLFLHRSRPVLGSALPTFLSGIDLLGGELRQVSVYTDDDRPDDASLLTTLANPDEVIRRFCGVEVGTAAPRIDAFGPQVVTFAGESVDVWVVLDRADPRFTVLFDGRPRRIVVGGERTVLTFTIARDELAAPGRYPIEICDPCLNECADPVYFSTRSPARGP